MICFWCFHQNDCNSQNWKARLRKRIHDETQDNYNKFEIIIVINILVHAHDWLNWYWKQSNVLFSPTINIYKKKTVSVAAMIAAQQSGSYYSCMIRLSTLWCYSKTLSSWCYYAYYLLSNMHYSTYFHILDTISED